MERHGWRAIIYDAPWARFQTGQTGVIVSEDGRSCETVDDNKSSIIVIADPNTTFEDRENGHILFRQKGSELFDIVCLFQGAGGAYGLEVSDVVVDGCVGITYGEFINNLIIYEVINGERKQVTKYEDKKAMIVKPTAIDGKDNFINTSETDATYTIQVSNGGATATARLISKGAGQLSREYVNSNIIGVDSVEIEKINNEGGSTYCSISLESGNKTGICTGGTVIFKAYSGSSSKPYYKINISGLSVIHNYKLVRCGITEGYTQNNGTVSVSVVKKNGVNVTRENSQYIEITVEDGISDINIIIIPDMGERQQITLSIPS